MTTPLMAALAAALLAPASPPQSTPFVDVTDAAGISFQQRRATRNCQLYLGAACEMEFMSGGIAVGDVNGDGWPDLYLTSIDGPDRLYENRRDGTFVDTTLARGLLRTEPTNAAQFVDVDQDGDQDLVVTVFAPSSATTARHHQLWIQGDDGTFDEQALARGFVPPGIEGMNGWGIAVGDIDRDGWPDLVLTQWIEDAPDASRVLMNRGAVAPGQFLASGHAWEVDLEGVWGFAATLVDLDHDGWQDLAVAGDFGTSRLYWNEGPAGFIEGTAAAGVGTDENGMGSAFGDVDGDGDLDWFVTSIWDPADTCGTGTCNWGITGNRLYVNEGGRGFRDGTDAFGVRDGAWGWGAAFLDFDNDARLDLVMTNGVQFPTPFAAPFFADRNRFWVQGGAGPMHEAAERAGLGDTGS
ncbi:MAG: VCBS repeat-containing protein, partial [Planctomycetota bacterium]